MVLIEFKFHFFMEPFGFHAIFIKRLLITTLARSTINDTFKTKNKLTLFSNES